MCRAAPETGKLTVKVLCIEVDEFLIRPVHTRIGRLRILDELAAETSHGRADLPSMGTGIARAGGQRQLGRNEVEVDRCVRGLLAVTPGDVVKEPIAQRPD